MKKITSLLLTLCICFSCVGLFASCDNNLPTNSKDETSDKQNPNSNSNSNEEEPNNEENPIVYSEGLEYSLSEDRTYLIVTDVGICKDTTIVIPPSFNDVPVKAIGYCAFGGGSFVKPNAPYVREVIIPDSVTEIGEGAFANNKYLKKITFGKSIENIADDAFYNCKYLEEVHISDLKSWCNITFCSYTSTPFYYGKNAKMYVNNNPITELIIPDGVTEIKSSAFSYCLFITKAKIGSSVTDISDGGLFTGAFAGCSNLTEVEISESVTHIGSYAFVGCSMLLNVVFEDPCNWKCTSFNDELYIPEIDLSISNTAAMYLADTYVGYDWYKQP